MTRLHFFIALDFLAFVLAAWMVGESCGTGALAWAALMAQSAADAGWRVGADYARNERVAVMLNSIARAETKPLAKPGDWTEP